MPKMRTCVKCGVEKPASQVAWGDARTHVKGVCFECMSPEDAEREMARREKRLERKKARWEANREKHLEQQKAYREANREKIREYREAYYKANREKLRESGKAYREANREKHLEQQKAYREANREKLRESGKAYKEANREKIREYMEAYGEANREKLRESCRRNRRDLKDSYVAALFQLPVKAVPKEIIELKRVQLQITREIRKQQEN